MKTLSVEIAPAFEPLLAPRRHKGAVGGRGGGKSRFYGQQLTLTTYGRPTRAVCLREVQQSLRDSVRQLIIDEIQRRNLGKFFGIFENEIRGPGGSLITFRGMQSFNAESIKSLEDYDIAWVEEAQTLSQRSLDLLVPTIRKNGSELWYSWNRRHRTDPVDVFFRENRGDPDFVCVEVGWRDNPWFPDVLRNEVARAYANDPELAEHIWGGGYQIGHGAILARQIDRIERAGQINDEVDFDWNGPGIEPVFDIGRRDATAVWWVQRRVGGLVILDFDSGTGQDAEEWIDRTKTRLDKRNWPLGRIWLPHDAKAKTFRSNLTVAELFLKAFGLGKVEIVPRATVSDQVNAARLTVPRCEFHATRCADGLEDLRAWQYEYNEETQLFSRAPQHSDTGSAFCYVAVALRNLAPPMSKEKPKPPPMRGVGQITVDELHRLDGMRDRKWA